MNCYWFYHRNISWIGPFSISTSSITLIMSQNYCNSYLLFCIPKFLLFSSLVPGTFPKKVNFLSSLFIAHTSSFLSTMQSFNNSPWDVRSITTCLPHQHTHTLPLEDHLIISSILLDLQDVEGRPFQGVLLHSRVGSLPSKADVAERPRSHFPAVQSWEKCHKFHQTWHLLLQKISYKAK